MYETDLWSSSIETRLSVAVDRYTVGELESHCPGRDLLFYTESTSAMHYYQIERETSLAALKVLCVCPAVPSKCCDRAQG